MMFHYSFTGGATIWFDTKPPDDVRQILRANGFRWHPASQRWWRRKVTGAADVLGASQKALAPKRPDGGRSSRMARAGAARIPMAGSAAMGLPPRSTATSAKPSHARPAQGVRYDRHPQAIAGVSSRPGAKHPFFGVRGSAGMGRCHGPLSDRVDETDRGGRDSQAIPAVSDPVRRLPWLGAGVPPSPIVGCHHTLPAACPQRGCSMNLAERYRPKTWDDVVGQAAAIKMLLRMKDRSGLGGHAFWINGQIGPGQKYDRLPDRARSGRRVQRHAVQRHGVRPGGSAAGRPLLPDLWHGGQERPGADRQRKPCPAQGRAGLPGRCHRAGPGSRGLGIHDHPAGPARTVRRSL